jgi:ribosomal protein S18 acetylase RimI-like enzyme
MRYELSPCSEHDKAWAYALKSEAYREVVERQFGPWDEDLQRRLFDERWDPAISQLVIIDGERAGLLALEDRGGQLWLDEIQIAQPWRGRGIGTTILVDVIRAAQAAGKAIGLQVLTENRRAMALYRRLGFEAVGETATHVVMRLEPHHARTE